MEHNTIQEDSLSNDNIELFKQYKNCTSKTKRKIRDKLIVKNQPLVIHIINKYYERALDNYEREDMVQEGTLGLMSAIEAFDVSLGYQFSTYAAWWIRHSINQYLRSDNIISIPPHIKSAQSKLIKELNVFSDYNEECGASLIDKMREFLSREDSGFTPRMSDSILKSMFTNNITLMSTLSSTPDCLITDESPESGSTSIDSRKVILSAARALDRLTNRERNVLLLRFNIINENDIIKEQTKLERKKVAV